MICFQHLLTINVLEILLPPIPHSMKEGFLLLAGYYLINARFLLYCVIQLNGYGQR